MTTISELQADLQAYRSARTAILTGQEYAIGNRRLRRPDLAEINKEIRELESRIAMQSNSGKINTGHAIFGGNR